MKGATVRTTKRALSLSHEFAESLRNRGQRPLLVIDLIKVALHLQSANRHSDKNAIDQFAANRGTRQNRDAAARDQRFFDGRRAAKLHGHIKQFFYRSTLPCHQVTK